MLMQSNVGRTTAMANFFLVGAPKAGTTSVDRLLRGHPEVFLSPIKEPCHFCPEIAAQLAPMLQSRRRIDLDAYLARPERETIHLLPVTSRDDYSRLYEGAMGHKVVGECTTFYLSSTQAARNIHAYNPDARIVALLRRPLDRIRSHYAMDLSLGTAQGSLLSLIEEELALGKEANWGNCRFYVGASRYASQLEEFYRYFPGDRVCVLSFEDLVADPAAELGRLFAFLGITPPAEPLRLPRANQSRAARFPWLHTALRGSRLKPLAAWLVEHAVPGRLSTAVKSAYYRREVKTVPDEELEEIAVLLRNEGLEPATSRLAAPSWRLP